MRPTTFTDTMLNIAANFVRVGAWGGLGGAGRVALIDIRDVATVFAVILTDDTHRHAGKIYDISGPAGVTMDEVAGYLSAASGTRIEYHARTEAQQRTVLESTGLSALMVDVLVGVDDITRDNVYAVPSPPSMTSPATPPARSTTGYTSTSRCSPHPPHSTAG